MQVLFDASQDISASIIKCLEEFYCDYHFKIESEDQVKFDSPTLWLKKPYLLKIPVNFSNEKTARIKAGNLRHMGEQTQDMLLEAWFIPAGNKIPFAKIKEAPDQMTCSCAIQLDTHFDQLEYGYWKDAFENPLNNHIKSPVQLLMPMAGRGARFGGETPKPLLPINNSKMFLEATRGLPKYSRAVFAVRESFATQTQAHLNPLNEKLFVLEGMTEGQAITVQLASKELEQAEPVVVSNCDYTFAFNPEKWDQLQASSPDVVVFTQRHYPIAELTPKAFAYVIADDKNNDISDVSVKVPISDKPSQDRLLIGTFYFKSVANMNELIEELVEKNIRVNDEYYLDSVVNLAIEKGHIVKCFDTEKYYCWGTPESVEEYDFWKGLQSK